MKLENKPVTQLSQQPIPPYERKQVEQQERQQYLQHDLQQSNQIKNVALQNRQNTAVKPNPQTLLKKSPPQKKAENPRQGDNDPICVLKIELDGEHVEEIKLYRQDEPHELVQRFGEQFNLCENAKQKLFDQIQEQLVAEYN